MSNINDRRGILPQTPLRRHAGPNGHATRSLHGLLRCFRFCRAAQHWSKLGRQGGVSRCYGKCNFRHICFCRLQQVWQSWQTLVSPDPPPPSAALCTWRKLPTCAPQSLAARMGCLPRRKPRILRTAIHPRLDMVTSVFTNGQEGSYMPTAGKWSLGRSVFLKAL